MERKHTLFFGDSRNLGSFLQKDSADLVVTGPPYFNEVVYSSDPGQLSAQTEYGPFLADIGRVWSQCRMVLKPGGVLAVWIHDFYRGEGSPTYIPFHADLLATLRPHFELKNILVWDRYLHRDKGTIPSERPLGTRLQYVLILQKPGSHRENRRLIDESLDRIFWQPVWSKKTHPELLGSSTLFRLGHDLGRLLGGPFGHLRKVLGRSPLVKDRHSFSGYATECPEEVAERMITGFSKPGDTVLDPFLGSGTTIRVAERLGRRCIGVEINKQALPVILSKVDGKLLDIVTCS